MKFLAPTKVEDSIKSIDEDCSFAYYSKNTMFRHVFLMRLKGALGLADDLTVGKILDLGSGCGYLVPSLNQYGSVYCVDYIADYLHRARKLCSLNGINSFFTNASGNYLPFKDKTFDRIFALSVFEHIPNIDLAISEVCRVVKDDGEVLVGLPIERFLVKSLFKIYGFEESVNELHVNDYRDVEKKLVERFRITNKKKILFNWVPDSFSLYVIFKCEKKR